MSAQYLNTLWYIIMILHSYLEQVLMISRVQEWQLSLSYFLTVILPLMDSDAISCPFFNLNTLWYIIMTFDSYLEKVMAMRRIQKC